MLDVLGVDPLSPTWSGGSDTDESEALRGALDVLVRSSLEERAAARAAKDFAAADSIRDRIAEAGIDIEDSAKGARWSIQKGQ